ncbi:MAG: hypothetical protein B7Z55_15770 [Planctomycetales bacterium 12-60-4]|nr:MAG: hypothetical protein B7Z55_15770 [Planctomycetales bacterium 12-60-4]
MEALRTRRRERNSSTDRLRVPRLPLLRATGALAAAAVGFSLRQLRFRLDDRAIPLTGMLAALVFAGQMVNFPLFGLPVSGHLLGGVLAATMLGPYAGCIALTVVLIVQAVMFADGGLLSLGANVLNMAVVGSWGGGAIYATLRRWCGNNCVSSVFAAVVASYISILAAASLFCLEFAGSMGQTPFDLQQLTWLMVLYHAMIGVGEAAITGAVLTFVWSRRPELLQSTGSEPELSVWRRLTTVGVACACTVAAVLSPWASEFPDGLEAVGERVGFNARGHDSVLLFSDYLVPVPAGWESVSVSAAGVLGTLVVLTLGWLIVARSTPPVRPVSDGSHAG